MDPGSGLTGRGEGHRWRSRPAPLADGSSASERAAGCALCGGADVMPSAYGHSVASASRLRAAEATRRRWRQQRRAARGSRVAPRARVERRRLQSLRARSRHWSMLAAAAVADGAASRRRSTPPPTSPPSALVTTTSGRACRLLAAGSRRSSRRWCSRAAASAAAVACLDRVEVVATPRASRCRRARGQPRACRDAAAADERVVGNGLGERGVGALSRRRASRRSALQLLGAGRTRRRRRDRSLRDCTRRDPAAPSSFLPIGGASPPPALVSRRPDEDRAIARPGLGSSVVVVVVAGVLLAASRASAASSPRAACARRPAALRPPRARRTRPEVGVRSAHAGDEIFTIGTAGRSGRVGAKPRWVPRRISRACARAQGAARAVHVGTTSGSPVAAAGDGTAFAFPAARRARPRPSALKAREGARYRGLRAQRLRGPSARRARCGHGVRIGRYRTCPTALAQASLLRRCATRRRRFLASRTRRSRRVLGHRRRGRALRDSLVRGGDRGRGRCASTGRPRKGGCGGRIVVAQKTRSRRARPRSPRLGPLRYPNPMGC